MAEPAAPAVAGIRGPWPQRPAWACLAGTIRSELTKLLSVRSTRWLLLILLLTGVGIGVLTAALAPAHAPVTFDPARASLLGLVFGQPVISVLGVLTITSEYSTGMISTSLAVQPRRGVLLAAKGIALSLLTMTAGLVTAFTAFFAGQAILSGKHLGTGLGRPEVLRAVVGSALFLTVCALIAFGLGTLLRYSAGAIVVSIGLLFLLPVMVLLLPPDWQPGLGKWLPLNAGTQLMVTTTADPSQFTAWTGFAVFADYAVVILLLAYLAFRRLGA